MKKKYLTFIFSFFLINSIAQQPADYFFRVAQSDLKKIYHYHFLNKNLDYPITWQCVASRTCEAASIKYLCATFESTNLPGKAYGKFVGMGIKETTYRFELAEDGIYLRLLAETYRDDDGTTHFSQSDLKRFFFKIPPVGQRDEHEDIEEDFTIKTASEIVSGLSINAPTYESVIVATQTFNDRKKNNKLARLEKFYFAKNVGLIKYEFYGADGKLNLSKSFELTKIQY